VAAPQTPLGELTALPLAGFKGPTSKEKEGGEGAMDGKERA